VYLRLAIGVINTFVLMNFTKKITLFLLLFSAGLLGLYLYKRFQVAPEISFFKDKLQNQKGEITDLSVFKGKSLIVSYYASWCGDCIKELKELNEIKQYKLSDTEVICVTDETLEKLIEFKTKKKYPFHYYKLPVSFSEIGIHAIPVTYLINSKGQVVYKKVGALHWKDPSFVHYVKNLLQN